MIRKPIYMVLCMLLLAGMLTACKGEQGVQGNQGAQGEQGAQGAQGEKGEKGEDGVSPTITISEDGYWVINGEKTDAVATVKEKEFVVGEEIFFEEGKEFVVPTYNGRLDPCRITAKIVAVEELALDDPSKWLHPHWYQHSYKYRVYVKGYCPVEYAGKKFEHTLEFRTSPYNGTNYVPTKNYESTVVEEDGYFEFSVDVYMPDVVTKVIPTELGPAYIS